MCVPRVPDCCSLGRVLATNLTLISSPHVTHRPWQVHIQRQREDSLFGHDFMRLRQVIYAFRPSTGILAEDTSSIAMAIEPVGFDRAQELIRCAHPPHPPPPTHTPLLRPEQPHRFQLTPPGACSSARRSAMTYSKAPEFVRMLQV